MNAYLKIWLPFFIACIASYVYLELLTVLPIRTETVLEDFIAFIFLFLINFGIMIGVCVTLLARACILTVRSFN